MRAQLQILNQCTHQNTQTLYKNRNISSRWMRPKPKYRKIKSTSRKSRARSSRRSRKCMLIPYWSALPKRCPKRCACVRDNVCESISMAAATEGFSPTSPFLLFFNPGHFQCHIEYMTYTLMHIGKENFRRSKGFCFRSKGSCFRSTGSCFRSTASGSSCRQ